MDVIGIVQDFDASHLNSNSSTLLAAIRLAVGVTELGKNPPKLG